jgi:hypothetical protein
LRVIGGHSLIVRIGERVGVNEGEVRHVDEALNLATRGALDIDRGRQYRLK